MKKLFQIITFAIAPLLLVGCDTTAERSTDSIAIINEAHGYADIYTAERFEERQASGEKFVVFLGADWCPGCVRLTKEIQANQEVLPAGTAILMADFDIDTELRRDYGAAVKHTAIYFDENGEHVKTKPGVVMQDLLAHLSGTSDE